MLYQLAKGCAKLVAVESTRLVRIEDLSHTKLLPINVLQQRRRPPSGMGSKYF